MAGVAPTSRTRLAFLALVIGYAIVSVYVASARASEPTTYASASAGAAVVDLAAGLGAVAAGCVGLVFGSRGVVAVLMTLIGVVWFAPDWVGWEGGPPGARSIAMVAAPFLVPLVFHLATAYPSGRPAGRATTVLVAAYGVTAIAAVGRALFRDPFRDLHCWSNCTDNVFLIRPDRDLTRFFDGLGLRSAVAVGMVGAVVCAWRLATATAVARRAASNVLVPSTAAMLALASYAAAIIADPAEDPTHTDHAVLFVLRAVSVTALAIGFAWGVVRTHRSRRAITRLAGILGAAPTSGTLGSSLARSFGDVGLRVAYRLSDSDRYVDANGRPADPGPGRGQATTAIVRGGEPLAVVVHDEALATEHGLAREIGAATRLAVDNERLRAETLAQLDDLRASRSRLVATADATRRRLERDLHDGAQQRLLAVLYELRLASAAAAADPDAELQERLDESTWQAERTLADLRELAHGIYPAILAEAGLGPALRTLADRAPIAVELDGLVDERFPDAVEAAAYLVVAEMIDHAARRSAAFVTVRVARTDAGLVVDVEPDGPMAGDAAAHLVDRVGAMGGELRVTGSSVRAEFPCAS